MTQWKVEDGALVFAPTEGERSGSENIISEETYTNFELSLEWKISEGGNSGIMWGVQEGEELNEPYLTGPEIQILDNERHPDAKNGPIRQSGALYDLSEPTKDVTNPAGEWNEMTITINYEENQGTVTLNVTQVNEFPLHG
ncbi:glycosyl hydrolase, partial [Flavobacterium sp. IR1]